MTISWVVQMNPKSILYNYALGIVNDWRKIVFLRKMKNLKKLKSTKILFNSVMNRPHPAESMLKLMSEGHIRGIPVRDVSIEGDSLEQGMNISSTLEVSHLEMSGVRRTENI